MGGGARRERGGRPDHRVRPDALHEHDGVLAESITGTPIGDAGAGAPCKEIGRRRHFGEMPGLPVRAVGALSSTNHPLGFSTGMSRVDSLRLKSHLPDALVSTSS